jgi:hypothetical protein
MEFYKSFLRETRVLVPTTVSGKYQQPFRSTLPFKKDQKGSKRYVRENPTGFRGHPFQSVFLKRVWSLMCLYNLAATPGHLGRVGHNI